MYYISKRIEVAFGHQLNLTYESKCQRFHGHNGMVVDFSHVKKMITDKMDHRCLNEIFDFNPTAENLAHWICEHVAHCYKVTFQESEGNLACYIKPGYEHETF